MTPVPVVQNLQTWRPSHGPPPPPPSLPPAPAGVSGEAKAKWRGSFIAGGSSAESFNQIKLPLSPELSELHSDDDDDDDDDEDDDDDADCWRHDEEASGGGIGACAEQASYGASCGNNALLPEICVTAAAPPPAQETARTTPPAVAGDAFDSEARLRAASRYAGANNRRFSLARHQTVSNDEKDAEAQQRLEWMQAAHSKSGGRPSQSSPQQGNGVDAKDGAAPRKRSFSGMGRKRSNPAPAVVAVLCPGLNTLAFL